MTVLGPTPTPLQVEFSEQSYQTLRELARRTGKSPDDILGEGLALARLYEETRARGGRVLLEQQGKYTEVSFG